MNFVSATGINRESVETKEEKGDTMGRINMLDKRVDLDIEINNEASFDELKTKKKP